MRWRVASAAALLLFVLLFRWAMPAAAGASVVPTAVVPDREQGLVGLSYAQALVERDKVSIVDIAAGALDDKLRVARGDRPVAFDSHNELWIAVGLRNPLGETQPVLLMVRQTSLNELTLFEPAGTVWHSQNAGDSVPQSAWARPGRFARFDLSLAPLETRTVYLRVRNNVPAPVPVQLGLAAATELWIARADFGLAFALGALAFLAVASFIQAVIYRDGTYFIFGGYALLLALSIAAISGVADELLWGEFPRWADAAKSFFPLAAAGISVFLVVALCRVRTRSVRLARTCFTLGGAVVAVAIGSAATLTVWAPVVAAAMLVAAATVLWLAAWTWLRGDTMGAWVAAAHGPMIATTALIVLRMFGIEPLPFRPNVLVSVSAGFILLLMLVALIRRSKELLAVRIRAQGMESIDPLTGLLSAQLFRDRVRAAVSRFERSRHDAAVMHVRLANHELIRERHGPAVAEQSMIRAAMKLQRVMREADCFGRVGESTMGLIVETVTRREALLERASRLVAHGLMPLPGLKPEVTLVLHVAIDVLSENPLPAERLHDDLEAQLRGMGVRTRRPIRFLAAESSGRRQAAREGRSSEGEVSRPTVADDSMIEDRA
jgi:diguanylate cyclase (GGDEF)-like protein